MVLLWGEERMRFTIPDYYREFTCIAGECPDTCCAGWQIIYDRREKSEKIPSGERELPKPSSKWN